MNTKQPLTPKYWIAHDPRTDDVYIDTASKSYDDCYEKIKVLMFGTDALIGAMDEGKIKISLVEIKIVKE